MLFTTQLFTFIVLPIILILSLIKKEKIANVVILLISSIFYSWAITSDLLRIYIYIFVIYLIGKVIEKRREINIYQNSEVKKFRVEKIVLAVSITALVLVLIHFKYEYLIISMFNFLFKSSYQSNTIIAPLGISFITFSAISYLADIYKGLESAGTLFECALYILFFPKVISGPIVLFRDFKKQLNSRNISMNNVYLGVNRIMIGFSKKIILADSFAKEIASVNSSHDQLTSFLVAFMYMMQIYFDFSGYSDVAIGLSNILGFEVKENFNFPYLSTSIGEFWRRWHISLGTWFKEYIYFPLGGSRVSDKRTYFNIFIVFLLTGIWHGAGYTFILWGLFNGLCNIIERFLRNNKLYQLTPKFVKWMITFVLVYFSWMLFRANGIHAFIDELKIMLNITHLNNIPYQFAYYVDNRLIVFLIIAFVCSTVFGIKSVQSMYNKLINTKMGMIINQLGIFVLFIISILFMISSTYSPFLYFQF